MSRAVKPLAGVLLLAVLAWQLDRGQLAELVATADWRWFAAAVVLSTLNNVFSALRWQRICHRFDLSLPPSLALRAYFQGVTANTVLPGGIVGGDVWRTMVLVSRGAKKTAAALTVLLDRASGFWLLGMVSLLACAWMALLAPAPTVHGFSIELQWIYVLGLATIVLGPLSFYWIRRHYFSALASTALISLAVQSCAVASFYCCLRAVGADIGVLAVLASATFIFLASVVPAAIGGFGSREAAAVIAFGAFGLSAEISFVASVLYGLTATIQGVAGVYAWVKRGR